MLMGNNNGIDTYGFVPFVLYRYLTFCIGTQPIDLFRLTQLSCFPQEFVRIHDRSRHQFRCFPARITEHHSLIPCAHLVAVFAQSRTVNSLRNIGRLGVNHT